MTRLHLDVWSDIACPWCYVGKRRLEGALARFEHRDAVSLRWRSFELDPSAPRVRDPEPYAERLARKYGTSREGGQRMIDTMTAAAAADGLHLRFDRIRPGNTFDAHRLLHLAAARGLGDAAEERFLRAYLTEGAAIGDPEVLARLAGEVGLDPDETRAVLGGVDHAADVRADEAEARRLGIGGVPFFLAGGRLPASGAQPPEVLLHLLERAWRDAEAEHRAAKPEGGAACGPEGCET